MVRSLPRGPRPARAADLSTSIAVCGFSGGGGWPWGARATKGHTGLSARRPLLFRSS